MYQKLFKLQYNCSSHFSIEILFSNAELSEEASKIFRLNNFSWYWFYYNGFHSYEFRNRKQLNTAIQKLIENGFKESKPTDI